MQDLQTNPGNQNMGQVPNQVQQPVPQQNLPPQPPNMQQVNQQQLMPQKSNKTCFIILFVLFIVILIIGAVAAYVLISRDGEEDGVDSSTTDTTTTDLTTTTTTYTIEGECRYEDETYHKTDEFDTNWGCQCNCLDSTEKISCNPWRYNGTTGITDCTTDSDDKAIGYGSIWLYLEKYHRESISYPDKSFEEIFQTAKEKVETDLYYPTNDKYEVLNKSFDYRDHQSFGVEGILMIILNKNDQAFVIKVYPYNNLNKDFFTGYVCSPKMVTDGQYLDELITDVGIFSICSEKGLISAQLYELSKDIDFVINFDKGIDRNEAEEILKGLKEVK